GDGGKCPSARRQDLPRADPRRAPGRAQGVLRYCADVGREQIRARSPRSPLSLRRPQRPGLRRVFAREEVLLRSALIIAMALVLTLGVAGPASAAGPSWYQDGPGGRLRFIEGWL